MYIYFCFINARLSQLDLKLQLDSLAAELKRLSLIQHDYLFSATSVSSLQNSTIDDKTISSIVPTATKTTSGDTSVLLDGYARRLCDARAKIAVVGNILESTQVYLTTTTIVCLYTNTLDNVK